MDTLPILLRIAAALEKIAAKAERSDTTPLIPFKDIQTFYPAITPSMIRDACNISPRGPRKFKDGIVSLREVEAWILREEKAKGVRQ